VKEFAKISPNKAAWEAAFERARSHVFAENIAKQAKAKPAVRKLRSNSLPDADWAGPGWKVFKPSSSEMRSSLPRQSGAAWLMSANLKPALRELAARSGRIVEFGHSEAEDAVIAALKAAASADETPAQRAMLLKRGLIEMVKGQLVINERGYDMMKKAGVPPKLTPEERREEIMGTEEEKRLSRFNHGEHGGHGVEFARGDYALASAEGVLSKLNPAFSLARSRSLTLGGAKAVAARVPRRGTAEVKKLADAVRWHRNNSKLALKNLPHNVNSEQGIFEKIYEGYPY